MTQLLHPRPAVRDRSSSGPIQARPRCRTSRRALTAALVTAVGGLTVLAIPAAAQNTPTTQDPALDQTVAADEAVVSGPATISQGHVDMGPRLIDDEWGLYVRDDTADEPVWRSLDETVFQVPDAAVRGVPDDPAYAFLGVEPGTDVHILPQTQNPAVPWLGWNTQDPAVMAAIDRGATLTLQGVEGPGEVTVYLQSGNFGEPEVLWQSTDPEPQPLWVDVNTHTHANWVFTAPGVYLMQIETSADLIDGEQVSATGTVRFAVGDATDVEAARTAEAPSFEGGDAEADAEGSEDAADAGAAADDGEDDSAADGSDDGGSGTVLVAVGAALVLVLLVAGVVVAMRGRGAKDRAERERAERAEAASSSAPSGAADT